MIIWSQIILCYTRITKTSKVELITKDISYRIIAMKKSYIFDKNSLVDNRNI